MTSSYIVSDAKPSDAHAIAFLFALSWTSPFTQLQFGYTDPHKLADAMSPRIEMHMQESNVQYMVVRHSKTQEVVSAAQWSMPIDDNEGEWVTLDQEEERQQFEDEVYRNRLPDFSNKDLIMEYTIGMRQLRQRALGRTRHYHLENIATHPDIRGQGLASELIKWVFPQADAQGVLVYLNTASDNNAMRLYKNLGFEEKARQKIEDLSKFGGEGSETHVALMRYPRNS